MRTCRLLPGAQHPGSTPQRLVKEQGHAVQDSLPLVRARLWRHLQSCAVSSHQDRDSDILLPQSHRWNCILQG